MIQGQLKIIVKDTYLIFNNRYWFTQIITPYHSVWIRNHLVMSRALPDVSAIFFGLCLEKKENKKNILAEI